MVREWADVRHWEATPATLISNKLVSIDAQWYRDGHINASYQYKYKGVSFVGTRVVIFIPPVARYDTLKALSDQLNKVANKSGELIVWVNPDDPSQSIISRELRFSAFAVYLYPLVGMALLSAFVFGFFKTKSVKRVPVNELAIKK